MALVVARSAPAALNLAVQAGRTAGLTGAALTVAKDLAGLLWRHRDALGGVSRSIFQHLKQSYFPTPPRGKGKKGKGRGARIPNVNSGGQLLEVPRNMGMYMTNPSFVDVEMKNFEGQPGMRVTFRCLLGLAVNVDSDWTSLTGAPNRAIPFLTAAGYYGTFGNGTSAMCTNDQNAVAGRSGRGSAVIIHPGLLNSRIQDFARMWCNYRFRHLSLGYCSAAGTGADGIYATAFVGTKEASADEAVLWQGNQILQCPGSSVFPIWSPGVEAAHYTYTGPEWYQCMVDVPDPTVNGYLWTNSGRDNFEECTQVILAGTVARPGPQVSTTNNNVLAVNGYFVLDGIVEFAGVCPASWDLDLVHTASVAASHGVKQTRKNRD